MNDPTIVCPKCETEFKLTEQLAAPVIDEMKRKCREHLDKELAKVEDQQTQLKDEQRKLAQDRKALDETLESKLVEERRRIAEEEANKATAKLQHEMSARTGEIADLKETLRDRDTKLGEARQAQANLMREKRELADEKAALELTVERRVQESLGAVKDAAKKEAEDGYRLTVSDRDRKIEAMTRQIEDLERRAKQGSQQHQGEVLELDFEDTLRRAFPFDTFEPVRKGEAGGDLIQRVVSARGTVVGTILWEVKRTKNWTDTWLPKLREDQRRANADAAVMVSQCLPKDIDTFDLRDDVWVASPQCAVPMAVVLRELVTSVFTARKASEGQLSKQEQLYQYMTGPRFKHRVRAVLEKYTDMRTDLDQERRVITKQWAKREQQLQSIADSLVGMSGDLHGIAGQNMMELESLNMSLLAPPEDSAEAA